MSNRLNGTSKTSTLVSVVVGSLLVLSSGLPSYGNEGPMIGPVGVTTTDFPAVGKVVAIPTLPAANPVTVPVVSTPVVTTPVVVSPVISNPALPGPAVTTPVVVTPAAVGGSMPTSTTAAMGAFNLQQMFAPLAGGSVSSYTSSSQGSAVVSTDKVPSPANPQSVLLAKQLKLLTLGQGISFALLMQKFQHSGQTSASFVHTDTTAKGGTPEEDAKAITAEVAALLKSIPKSKAFRNPKLALKGEDIPGAEIKQVEAILIALLAQDWDKAGQLLLDAGKLPNDGWYRVTALVSEILADHGIAIEFRVKRAQVMGDTNPPLEGWFRISLDTEDSKTDAKKTTYGIQYDLKTKKTTVGVVRPERTDEEKELRAFTVSPAKDDDEKPAEGQPKTEKDIMKAIADKLRKQRESGSKQKSMRVKPGAGQFVSFVDADTPPKGGTAEAYAKATDRDVLDVLNKAKNLTSLKGITAEDIALAKAVLNAIKVGDAVALSKLRKDLWAQVRDPKKADGWVASAGRIRLLVAQVALQDNIVVNFSADAVWICANIADQTETNGVVIMGDGEVSAIKCMPDIEMEDGLAWVDVKFRDYVSKNAAEQKTIGEKTFKQLGSELKTKSVERSKK